MTDAHAFDRRSALAFIIAFGVVSLFADMAYEGMRGISGPFLATLGASGAAVGAIAGTGELFGYLLRLGSGRFAERTGLYWPLALTGYIIQMAAVPMLALAGNWWSAALFIILERTGKAVRNPAANTMMSRAGEQIGQGWAFGLHEAMDQTGALAGPLIAALVLAHHGHYTAAFEWLGIPAALTVLSVIIVSLRYPYAGRIAPPRPGSAGDTGLPRAFWLYAASAALTAFGFVDYPLIAFHFTKAHVMSAALVPILYALAMGASGAGSLVFGRWFDVRGLVVLVPGLVITAIAAPLAFLGGFDIAIVGALSWGLALGIHDAIMNAAVATMVPAHARARAYGYFTAIYGTAWFLGSALLGLLFDRSLVLIAVVSLLAQLAALIPLFGAMRAMHSSTAER
ncbi:MAG TPA: MFS transporter [Rhizomicrobium sp.]|jgi:MFS family permease